MHSYLKDAAWLCIAVGALFAFPAAAMPARRPDGQRHGQPGETQARRRRGGEAWPDLRTCLTVMAIGASLLADQASDYRTRLLTSVPIFAVVGWNITSWVVSRRRRAPDARPPGHGSDGTADPRYRGRAADPGVYR
jgi:hypothetical protein